jgi:hypothetical protein
VGDRDKLFYLLGYLERTKGRVLTLRPKGIFKLEAYIDASFALHPDGKSHTGIVVLLGGVGVFYASRKQKCPVKVLRRQSWWHYQIMWVSSSYSTNL